MAVMPYSRKYDNLAPFIEEIREDPDSQYPPQNRKRSGESGDGQKKAGIPDFRTASATKSTGIGKRLSPDVIKLYTTTIESLGSARRCTDRKDGHSPRKSRQQRQVPTIKEPEALQEELLYAKGQINDLTQERKVMATKIRTLEQEISKMDRRYEEMLAINSMSYLPGKTGRAAKDILIPEDKTISSLRSAAKHYEKKTKELEATVASLKQSTRYTTLVNRELECKNLFQDNLRLRRLLEHWKADTHVMEQDSDTLLGYDRVVDELTQKLNEALRQNATLKGHSSNQSNEQSPQLASIATLESTISDLQHRLATLDRAYKTAVEEMHAVKEKAGKEIKEWEQKYRQLDDRYKDDMEKLRIELGKMEKPGRVDNKLRDLQEQLKGLQDALDNLGRERDRKTKELVESQGRCVQFEKHASILKKELEDLRKKLRESNAAQESLSAQYSAECSVIRKERDQYQKDYMSELVVNEKLRKEVETLDTLVKELRRKTEMRTAANVDRTSNNETSRPGADRQSTDPIKTAFDHRKLFVDEEDDDEKTPVGTNYRPFSRSPTQVSFIPRELHTEEGRAEGDDTRKTTQSLPVPAASEPSGISTSKPSSQHHSRSQSISSSASTSRISSSQPAGDRDRIRAPSAQSLNRSNSRLPSMESLTESAIQGGGLAQPGSEEQGSRPPNVLHASDQNIEHTSSVSRQTPQSSAGLCEDKDEFIVHSVPRTPSARSVVQPPSRSASRDALLEVQRNEAAQIIQALVRGHIARKKYPQISGKISGQSTWKDNHDVEVEPTTSENHDPSNASTPRFSRSSSLASVVESVEGFFDQDERDEDGGF
ncbi:uncharacterized protein SPPG_01064 [Spizellomyces punctatus DAOM BR117]|uniref:Uncharacterized protein n=1 Tax=Spizellomyces punctatus (strain DAOM BR117) TaxID=645134 RepID=A0A0L0HRB6_SPIPD|nr:uncharacterized protein SPPG_01064 [Spizellomyces punctatus DAOM BR117]KND03588.1 hypothetical protein SPPG_01064 [Spizellomyces punctatus DAOM BR117]|eukprot:XP_016611627.1 hypothetical protein SPPG_01064 [Spizellomyces punctatus DAOM BR117]